MNRLSSCTDWPTDPILCEARAIVDMEFACACIRAGVTDECQVRVLDWIFKVAAKHARLAREAQEQER